MSGAPDTIHQRGRDAVLAGRELLDVPPGPGSTRWGLSLDVFPDPEAEARLAALADEAAALAGPGQWRTGGTGSAHLTVTYLERDWREVGADDPEVRRHAGHLRRAAAASGPLRWDVTGLVLADRGVLALCAPVDDAPAAFRSAILAGLGGLGAEEAGYRRAVWWSTLLHFAAPVADRAGLVDWVEAREALPEPLVLRGDRASVVHYAFDGQRTSPQELATTALPGVPEGASGGAHA
ncbi:MAG TPA: hypothetical protein VFR56_02105 [Actinomycetes bacterium]|nr:hypothetical protein [Actinomycetes bacterium]